jgi:hypothetical protein
MKKPRCTEATAGLIQRQLGQELQTTRKSCRTIVSKPLISCSIRERCRQHRTLEPKRALRGRNVPPLDSELLVLFRRRSEIQNSSKEHREQAKALYRIATTQLTGDYQALILKIAEEHGDMARMFEMMASFQCNNALHPGA